VSFLLLSTTAADDQSCCYFFLLSDLSIRIASHHLVRESQKLTRRLLRKSAHALPLHALTWQHLASGRYPTWIPLWNWHSSCLMPMRGTRVGR
jgi:hypothetical protein